MRPEFAMYDGFREGVTNTLAGFGWGLLAAALVGCLAVALYEFWRERRQ